MRRLLVVVAAIAVCGGMTHVTGAQDLQTLERSRPGQFGDIYRLNRQGRFTLRVTVENKCDTLQDVIVGYAFVTLNGSEEERELMIAPHASQTLDMMVTPTEPGYVKNEHGESGIQANIYRPGRREDDEEPCVLSGGAKWLFIEWADEGPTSGLLGDVLHGMLTPRRTDQPQPPSTPPTSPEPPATPQPGTGLEYPAVPIPGANPDPVDPDNPPPPKKPDPKPGDYMEPTVTEKHEVRFPGTIYLEQGGTYFIKFNVDNRCDHSAPVDVAFDPNWGQAAEVMGPQQTFIAPANSITTFLAHVVPSPAYEQAWTDHRVPQGRARMYGSDPTPYGDDCSGGTHVPLADFRVLPGFTVAEGPHPSGTTFPGGTFVLTPSSYPPASPPPAFVPPHDGPVPSFLPDPGCSESAGCIPFDNCGIGNCGDVATPAGPSDNGFQILGAETVRVKIDITIKTAERAMNPLGLLSKSVEQFIDWWMPTLEAAEQNLQQGLQFLITSQGGSTGKNMTMQVLNFSGKAVNLEGMLALEPLKKDAQQKATQAFAKLAGRQLPTKVDLNGYCFEFLKLPPIAGQVMRVSPPEVQQRFAPLKKVMAAANRLKETGGLRPDSNPAAYADSIKQWAIWTVQEKFDQSKFADAFVNHTKKNIEAAGQKWSSQIEAAIRQAAPNRWNDITQILKTAAISPGK